jgi:hypothetical protein
VNLPVKGRKEGESKELHKDIKLHAQGDSGTRSKMGLIF